MTSARRPKDPWSQLVQPYTFAWALGYQQEWEPEADERACLVNGDWLCCRFYEWHVDLELYARYPDEETTEYGSNAYRFDEPATVREWFAQLCRVDHIWEDTDQDQREFMDMYENADTARRVEVIKQLFRALTRVEAPPTGDPQGILDL